MGGKEFSRRQEIERKPLSQMDFIDEANKIMRERMKNKGSIILVNAGSFYIARGRDAILLNAILDLKVSCMEIEVCKVGFPINSLEKYTNKIEEKDYSYIVYNYNNIENKLEKIKEFKGKKENTIIEDRKNCYICTNTVKMYKKTDKYMQAVLDLYNKEEK